MNVLGDFHYLPSNKANSIARAIMVSNTGGTSPELYPESDKLDYSLEMLLFHGINQALLTHRFELPHAASLRLPPKCRSRLPSAVVARKKDAFST